MPNVNHRVAFNCDLFLTIAAPADATSEELERLVLERLKAHDVIESFPVPALPGHARVHLRWADESDDARLENFTVVNVEELRMSETKYGSAP